MEMNLPRAKAHITLLKVPQTEIIATPITATADGKPHLCR